MQAAIHQAVDPAVEHQRLPPAPGVTHQGGAGDIAHLFDDVELAQGAPARLVIGQSGEERLIPVAHVLDVAQPVVNQSQG